VVLTIKTSASSEAYIVEHTFTTNYLWRTGTVGVKVVFTEYTPFKSKKELFIADSKHKQNVINILSKKKLVVKVCSTIYASDDACLQSKC
jgi:hypothetical protein